MSLITTIDTLQFSNRMQKSGLNKKIADELAEVIKESQGQSIEGLATKQDICDLRKDFENLRGNFEGLREDFEDLREDFEKDLELTKKDLIIKLGSLITIGITILAGLIKL